MLSTRKNLEVCLEEPNLTIYSLYEGNRMTLISEYFAADSSTSEFKFFIQDWIDTAKTVNPMIEKIERLPDVEGYEVLRQEANAPWPLSNRVVFVARYPCIDYAENEHLMILSERGSESRFTWSEQEDKDYALAHCFLAGWNFAPAYDSSGNEVGTNIYYISSADAGGNIPQTLQNKAGPSQSQTVITNLVSLVVKRRQEKQ